MNILILTFIFVLYKNIYMYYNNFNATVFKVFEINEI